MARLYAAAWSVTISLLWLATNHQPTTGWVISLFTLQILGWVFQRWCGDREDDTVKDERPVVPSRKD